MSEALGSRAGTAPAHRSSEGKKTGVGWVAWLVPSLADVMFAALLGLALGLRAHQMLNSDGDLARHLAVGRQILADGAIPLIDLFSHTKGGEPFVPYEWLSEVIFALAYRQLGLEGVVVLAATVAALPFLLLTRWMVRDGANPFIVLVLATAGALATSMHWLARPHLFTLLLALLWTRALVRHRETGSLRPLVALPPMMVLWANLHGGFLVGFVQLGIFLVAALLRHDRAARAWPGQEAPGNPCAASDHFGAQPIAPGRFQGALPIAAAGALSLVAVGINPVGYSLLPHVLSYPRSRFMVDNTVEYLSPNFHDLGPQLFLGLLLVAIGSLALAPRRVTSTDLGMLGVWTVFALYSARNIPLFVVICLPLVARLATEALGGFPGRERGRLGVAGRLAATERQLGRPLLPALVVVLALLVSTGAIAGPRPRAAFDPAVFPVQALTKAEEAGAHGNMFNYFSWGGYVLYAAYPRYRVFIDGQTDFYGEQLMRDYLKISHLDPDWETLLDRYQVDWVLFRHQAPLSLLLARTGGWKLVYEDATADIFVRIPSKER